MIWIDPIAVEGYEPSVEYGPAPTAFEPKGPLHNVCEMRKTASSLMTDRLRCPECNWVLDIIDHIAEGRVFTCGGEQVRAYPPL